MDVQDPTYKSSAVFDQCQDDPDNFIKNDEAPGTAAIGLGRKGAAAPQNTNAMNSTGKEFYAKNSNQQISGEGVPMSEEQHTTA